MNELFLRIINGLLMLQRKRMLRLLWFGQSGLDPDPVGIRPDGKLHRIAILTPVMPEESEIKRAKPRGISR